jgi:hypothetical protein
MNRICVGLANILWLASCLPGLVLFLLASCRARQTQEKLLAGMLARNAGSDRGRTCAFSSIRTSEAFQSVPISEYEDYAGAIERIKKGEPGVLTREPVTRLHPTSGSTSATKWIPSTMSLQREFKAAIDPWIASLFLARPSLLGGLHYWSISPSTPVRQDPDSTIRMGFADDLDYLGVVQRWLARALFAVPPEVGRVADPEAFEYLTLFYLCRNETLRLISVWHPSFLTLLLRAIPRHLPALIRDIESGVLKPDLHLPAGMRNALTSRLVPNRGRAEKLRRIDLAKPDYPQQVWPRLTVVSCWNDGTARSWMSELTAAFPGAWIQGKGLMATEGAVTVPMGRTGKKVCAVRSHFLEFIEEQTSEVRRMWEVQEGRAYSVVVTTGGGLYRYRLHDLVRVTGFFNQIPCLEFLARDNRVVDLVGEKMNERHVRDSIQEMARDMKVSLVFAMVAPIFDRSVPGYVLYVQTGDRENPDYVVMAHRMESAFCRNYQYLHARQVGQLQAVRIFRIRRNAETHYRLRLTEQGMKAGDIKYESLSREASWNTRFDGELVDCWGESSVAGALA